MTEKTEKACAKCGSIKLLPEFHNNPSAKDGKTSRCKSCAIEAAKASYERRKREESPEIDIVREHRARLASARAAGETHFMPLIPCPAGHLSPRFTKSQCCKECGKLRNRSGSNEDEAARLKKKRIAFKRKVAKQLGMTHYDGSPCKNGHDGKRLVSTRQCVDCLAARTNDRKTKMTPESHRRRLAKRRTKASRVRQNAYQADVLMKRPEYLATRFMYACVRRILQGAGQKKRSRTVDAIGYTHQQLKAHIESLFDKEMTWENYGDWHIDHIKPISMFIAEGVTDPAIINALTNLQPLWAVDNMSKGGFKVKRN